MKNKNLRNALMKMQGMENSNSEIEIIKPEKANVHKGGLNIFSSGTVCNPYSLSKCLSKSTPICAINQNLWR